MAVCTRDMDALASDWSKAARAAAAAASATRGALPSKPPQPPAPHELAPECRWKILPAVLQAPLLRRSNKPSLPAADGLDISAGVDSDSELESRFFWLSPAALCYWRTTLDALSCAPRRAFAYERMQRVLLAPDERNDLAEGRFLFRIDMMPEQHDGGEHEQSSSQPQGGELLTMCADSAWQRTIWLQALANKGVPVQMMRQPMTPSPASSP
jgi:hypothetical protein